MPVNNFSESPAKQTIKKIYSIDTGISLMLSFTLSKDEGRLFENIIFLELKRRGKEIYYYKEKLECDFIIKEKDKITEAMQICYDLNENNEEREINGLKEAMRRFKLKKGLLLTFNQRKNIDGIEVIPAYEWLLRN